MTARPARAVGSLLALTWACAAVGGCRPSAGGTAECTPGRTVLVACGCEGVGICSERPDPVLRVCEGTVEELECTWNTQLAENDDGEGCGRCPAVRVTCPESGSLLVVPRSYYPDEIVHCEWALREE